MKNTTEYLLHPLQCISWKIISHFHIIRFTTLATILKYETEQKREIYGKEKCLILFLYVVW